MKADSNRSMSLNSCNVDFLECTLSESLQVSTHHFVMDFPVYSGLLMNERPAVLFFFFYSETPFMLLGNKGNLNMLKLRYVAWSKRFVELINRSPRPLFCSIFLTCWW